MAERKVPQRDVNDTERIAARAALESGNLSVESLGALLAGIPEETWRELGVQARNGHQSPPTENQE